MSKRIALFPALLLALLVIVATALTWMNFSQALPRSQWAQAAWSPDIDVIEQMIFHYSLLPRLAISLLVGAGLGLVGVLFQQVLRNPLAEPTTLGVATGAQLGITVTTLWAIPGAMASQFAALAGACVVGLIVFGVAWGKRLSPVTLILAGLVVSLYCGAINQLLVIFHHDQLQSMFLWSTGTLTQTDWGGVERLWPQLLGGVMLTLLLLRPLTLMGLDDGVARNLGLALSLARLAALSLAIVISALLVNAVGIIGFIGLFAPLLAKMAQDAGLSAVTVHGRTRAQRFSGAVSLSDIAAVVHAVTIPVIANGDIDGPPAALAALRTSGAAGVMVGRAARGNPWIFRRIRAVFEGYSDPGEPTLEDRCQTVFEHLEEHLRYWSEQGRQERFAVHSFRMHLRPYLREAADADASGQAQRMLDEIVRIEEAERLKENLETFFSSLRETN